MLRAVAFDFNGILVDDEPLHCRLFQEVLAEEGIELTERDYYELYLGFDDRGVFAALLEREGRQATEPLVGHLIEVKAQRYRECIDRDGYPFFPGAVELARSCAERGWRLSVVSGALREEVEEALKQSGLAPAVELVVAAEDVERGKPDPEGYRRALEGLDALAGPATRPLLPREVVAVEDSPAGLASAAAAGLRTLGVAQTYPAAEIAEADAVVDRLEGLTAADLEALVGGKSPLNPP